MTCMPSRHVKHNDWDKNRTAADFPAGCRVEFHPCTDLWASGARYGAVTSSKEGEVVVQPDKSRPKVRITDMELIRRIS